MKTTALKSKAKRLGIIVMILVGITFASKGFSQYYDITGTWVSTSGNAFTVTYTYDFSGNITGVKTTNIYSGDTFYYTELTPNYYCAKFYDVYGNIHYNWILVSNCFNITAWDLNSKAYWSKL